MSVAMLYQGMAVVAFRELFESLLLSQFCGRYGYERGRIATNSSLEPPGMGSSSSSSRIAPLGLAIFSASSAHVSRRGTAHFFRKRRRIRAEIWTENGGLNPIPPPQLGRFCAAVQRACDGFICMGLLGKPSQEVDSAEAVRGGHEGHLGEMDRGDSQRDGGVMEAANGERLGRGGPRNSPPAGNGTRVTPGKGGPGVPLSSDANVQDLCVQKLCSPPT